MAAPMSKGPGARRPVLHHYQGLNCIEIPVKPRSSRDESASSETQRTSLAALSGGLAIKDVAAQHGESRWIITRLRNADAEQA